MTSHTVIFTRKSKRCLCAICSARKHQAQLANRDLLLPLAPMRPRRHYTSEDPLFLPLQPPPVNVVLSLQQLSASQVAIKSSTSQWLFLPLGSPGSCATMAATP